MSQVKKHSVVCILGMHRSGTSLLSGWLEKCGLHIGSDLLKTREDNPKGHFEDKDFLDFHKVLLKANGEDTRGLDLKKETYVIPDNFHSEATSIIQKFSDHNLWGWKEPRTTLFINYWKEKIPGLVVIAIYRDYEFVVDSLYRRDYIRFGVGKSRFFLKNKLLALKYKYSKPSLGNMYLKAWIKYNQNIISFSKKFPEQTLIVNISTLVQSPTILIKEINNRFNISLKEVSFENIFDTNLIKDKNPNTNFQLNLSLLKKANMILNELNQYSFKPNHINVLSKSPDN